MTPNREQFDPDSLRGLGERRLSRRDLLRYAGVGAGAIGMAAFLEACGFGGGTTTRSRPSALLPAHTSPPPPPSASHLAKVAESMPDAEVILERIWQAYRPDRSGQVQYVPIPMNFVDGGINHSGPWDYLQRIPLLFYGPGYVKAQGRLPNRVTLADIAPTMADLMHFDGFKAPDGRSLTEALLPASARRTPPKLIVVLVWDAGGRIVLDFWHDKHPYLDSMITKGTYFDKAEAGASPSSTAPGHASIGTGALPRHHGILGNDILYEGHVIQPWKYGPKLLLEPTLADVYDKATGNRATIGVVGTTPWYLGMIGHGSLYPGGDKDIAVLRPATNEGAEGSTWGLPPEDAPYYRFPSYVNSLPPLRDYFKIADGADGNYDGTWRGRNIEALAGGFNTPARLPYQTKVIQTVLERENFGHNPYGLTDLFFTNYKLIDEIGHLWYFNSPEEGDAIKIQDGEFKVLVDFLDSHVGSGKYVLIMTADHAHTPNPKFSGGFRISGGRLKAGVAATFGTDTLRSGKPTYLFMNEHALARGGFTLSQAAEYLLQLTKGDTYFTAPDAFGPADKPKPGHFNDPINEAAFPSSMLTGELGFS